MDPDLEAHFVACMNRLDDAWALRFDDLPAVRKALDELDAAYAAFAAALNAAEAGE